MAAAASEQVPEQGRPTAGPGQSRVWPGAVGAVAGSPRFQPPADLKTCVTRVSCLDASRTPPLKSAPFQLSAFQPFRFSISLPATFGVLVTPPRQSFWNGRGQGVVMDATKCGWETRGDAARPAVGSWKTRLGGWGVRAKEEIGATAGGIRPRGWGWGWGWGLGGGGRWGWEGSAWGWSEGAPRRILTPAGAASAASSNDCSRRTCSRRHYPELDGASSNPAPFRTREENGADSTSTTTRS
jgi:hypothetical protein